MPQGEINLNVHHIDANYFLDETSMKPQEDATFSFSGGGGVRGPLHCDLQQFSQRGAGES
uniref:Uncharacterized protein n=1 Tax=Oncorhynchus mykiss TaxID=8022 RepID=A0A8K9X4R3_ONCMY